MKKIAKPKLDLVFKKIFGDVNNIDLLTDFLSSVLDVPTDSIQNVEIIDNEIIPDTIEKKFSRLDLLILVNHEYVNIEIQVNNYNDYKERTLFYWAKVYANQLAKSEDYISLQNTIAINIVDFKLFDCTACHSSFMIYETHRHEKLTDKLRIDFLELPKAKDKTTNTKLQEWLDFLNVTTEEGLEMLEKNTVNPAIMHKAVAVVRQMSADEQLLRAIQKREETLMNERSALNTAKRQGIEQGLKEKETELIARWRKKGYTDEQIQELLSE
ncbi:MAG: Rpn family recombination-promoting nuclease/putative transposase [Oscillospiraceae bacterium]|nr:Rpn family recombination-promoting nuclease/putative transposase [Oscillospiraceae bacterium]